MNATHSDKHASLLSREHNYSSKVFIELAQMEVETSENILINMDKERNRWHSFPS